MRTRNDRVERLLADHGRTYCDELGIAIARDKPQPLFRWLVVSLLLSARIGAGLAVKGAVALHAARLDSAERMVEAGWERRVRILNRSGYARYDERTSTRLEETSTLVIDRYGGDLRGLRSAANGKRARILALLREFNGIGPLGAAIFCREVQVAWDELHPFADTRTRDAARAIGLPHGEAGLAGLVERAELPRLLAALTRARLAKRLDDYR